MPFLCIFVFLFSINSAFGSIDMSPEVSKVLEKNNDADVILYFRNQDKKIEAQNILDRNQRIQYLVQELIGQAENSQKDLLHYLSEKSYEYQSFFVENAVRVPKADKKLLSEIISFPQVSRVRMNSKIVMQLPALESPRKRGIEPHIQLIKADQVWDKHQVYGEGIVIASADTGVYWQHNSIRKQYRGYSSEGPINHNYNWHDAIHGDRKSVV